MIQNERINIEASFLKILDPVLMCSSVTNTVTGETIQLNLTDKVVVSYVNNRAEFFENNNMKMFESQDTIADSIGVDRKTVLRSLKKLESVGLVCREIKYHVNKDRPSSKPTPRTTYLCVKLIGNENYVWKSDSVHRTYNQETNKVDEHNVTKEYSIIPLKQGVEEGKKHKQHKFVQKQQTTPTRNPVWFDEDSNMPF